MTGHIFRHCINSYKKKCYITTKQQQKQNKVERERQRRNTEIEIIFGAAFTGEKDETTLGVPVLSDPVSIQNILNEYKNRGHLHIDTARNYGSGTSEAILASVDYAKQGFLMDTKVLSSFPGAHSAANVAISVQKSLDALKTDKIHTLYLHLPDRTTPFEETLSAINEEYKKGRFEKFGLSNYSAQEVDQIVTIAKEKGYVQPTVYQGLYNLLSRKNEDELFPVLRKHGIRFCAYSPLAGGFLIGKISKEKVEIDRLDSSNMIGQVYQACYFKDSLFKAVDKLIEEGEKTGITLPEMSLRWIMHHSLLSQKYNDAVITGARNINNVIKSLDYLEKPALPERTLKVIEEVWQTVKDDAPPYFY